MTGRRGRVAWIGCVLWGAALAGCPNPPHDVDTQRSTNQVGEVTPEVAEVDEVDEVVEVEAEGVGIPPCEGPDDCDDGNDCTIDRCDPAGCSHSPRVGSCDDGNRCTDFDACLGSVCAGVTLDCDDHNDCTDDTCDAAVGCVWAPRTGPCDDANACTRDDVCAAGDCRGTVVACPANTPCRSYACEPAEGCVAVDVVGACDDGDVCTAGDSCARGLCVGLVTACDDDNACTDDYCEPASGCGHRANHAACQDGSACTVGDRCEAGACHAGPPTGTCCDADVPGACEDNDGCTIDACDAGACVHRPLACDDADPCTEDGCAAGACTHEAWPTFVDDALVVADFEAVGSLADWELASDNADVVWQRDDAWAADGSWSLYLGDVADHSYDHGATRATARTLIAMPPDTGTLTLAVKADVDEASCVYDALRVRIGSGPWQIVTCGDAETTVSWPIGEALRGSRVPIEFVFETFDNQRNAGGGLWLDHLALVPAVAPTCR